MKCPNDGAILTMSERSGVEIDYCPECRGVWLDRGELDKILDRVAAESPTPVPPVNYQERPQAEYRPQPEYRPQAEQFGYQQGRRPKRKEHWLSEIFD